LKLKLRIALFAWAAIALAAASMPADANVNTAVWTELKAIAPPNTAFAALVYGPMKYVMADADYPSNSYPVTASMAKVGCAEQGFITKAMSMIKEIR
jgi:neutral ceramidase